MKNKQITLREMRSIQLAMLKSIHQFCTVNNIRYSLSGGSLIGAVRHQGFIPWDDDVDLMMPRPDYERFLKSYEDRHYKIITYKNDNSYHFPFAKVFDDRTILIEDFSYNGVYVDLFPVDGLPDNEEEMTDMMSKVSRLSAHDLYFASDTYRYQPGNKVILKLKHFFKKMLVSNRDTIIRNIEEICNKYSFDSANFAGVLVWGYGLKEYMPSFVFKSYQEVEFEEVRCMCISDYDIYLTSLYGNYMELPPMEARVSHHKYKVYWKDDLN